MRVSAEHLDSVLHPQFAARATCSPRASRASPGAAVGAVYFTADDAAAANERGEKVVLVRNETSPEDVHGMMVAEGILTARGGLVSHAAVVARGWGTPASSAPRGEDLRQAVQRRATSSSTRATCISIDGTTGEVVARRDGAANGRAAAGVRDDPRLGRHDPQGQARRARQRRHRRGRHERPRARRRGHRAVPHRAHVPRPRPPAGRARDDPGLARPSRRRPALEELREVQQADFEEMLEAMDGLPVTVRLLDPPLHEFLPSVEELRIKEATTGLDQATSRRELDAAESVGRAQPDDRHPRRPPRGDQARPVRDAGARAARRRRGAAQAQGKNPIVEIMIPLTVTREEMALARSWVEEEIDAALTGMRKKPDITIGTMIETPRAAVRADEIAEVADFFSFGTNDLTQLTFGFSRDDVESRMMPQYLEQGLLKRNPFDTIDQTRRRRPRADRRRAWARPTKPKLKLGVCGEHGGDPESIDLFYDAGLDYVSCSPFRVPIARLSAAQAVIATARAPTRPGWPRGRRLDPAMGIVDEDIERLRSTVSIVDTVQQYVALEARRSELGRAVPVPRREERVVQRLRGDAAATSASAATRAATCSRSSRRSSTSTSPGRWSISPTRPGSSSTTRPRASRRSGHAQAARRGDGRGGRVVPPTPAQVVPTPVRRATTCVPWPVRRHRPPVQARVGTRRLGRARRESSALRRRCCRTSGCRSATAATGCRTRSGPGDVPDLLRVR